MIQEFSGISDVENPTQSHQFPSIMIYRVMQKVLQKFLAYRFCRFYVGMNSSKYTTKSWIISIAKLMSYVNFIRKISILISCFYNLRFRESFSRTFLGWKVIKQICVKQLTPLISRGIVI